jgi:hypothetical protein
VETARDTFADGHRGGAGDEGPGACEIQPGEAALRESRPLAAACFVLAHREEKADVIRIEPTGGEPNGVRRGGVEPLCVVNHNDERIQLTRLGEQAHRRRTDGEAVAHLAR